jgi:PAS domain S-box-containing protein
VSTVDVELTIARRQLEEAQRLARIGSWEWDITDGSVWWSDELYRIYGLKPCSIEPSYEEFLNYVHADDRAAVDERNRRAFADHQPFEDVKRVVRADGRDINMRTQGDVVCDEDDRPVRMVGICEDVTDQLRAREAEKHLAAADALRQRAGAINDEIVQRLVLAGAMLERGEVDQASEHLAETLARAKRIAGDLILGAEQVQPGDLRRSNSAV